MPDIIPYTYRNLPIPGGGYVTGFLFSKRHTGLLYARTDIGGTYRYDYAANRWHNLISHVSMQNLSETYPAAISLDESNPDRLFIICGTHNGEDGIFAMSEDRGENFIYKPIPTPVHGNWAGRGTGYRLVVDENDSNTLYYASQRGGLLRTRDLGTTWEEIPVNGEKQMTFVWLSPDSNTIVIGTAGLAHKDKLRRGHSLYISYDKGQNFSPLPMPSPADFPGSRLSGLVAQRCEFDGTFLYITCSVTGRHPLVTESGYSCDCGDIVGGRVLRYSFDSARKISDYRDITPIAGNTDTKDIVLPEEPDFLEYGFSGITSSYNRIHTAKPGLVACSTICKGDGDMIFLSYDYGNTWECKLYDLSIGKMEFDTPYMRPCYNGGHNLIHWLSDIKCNPFNPDELWFNTGTGIFVTRNLTSPTAIFSDCCKGLEETVHLNIYSLPAGEVQVIDILGDLGGFAFRDLDTPCENSFSDVDGNRYITCINADFSDYQPQTVIITPRGNWSGKTKGGLILSHDQCRSFERLPMPYGLSSRIDSLLVRIEQPNINSGWVAMSPDCRNIVWSIAEGQRLPMDAVVSSTDGGKSFVRTRIMGADGDSPCLKVYADRVNSSLMYGFGSDSQFYISKDGGLSFLRYMTPPDCPSVDFGMIDCSNKVEIRAESGREGVLYLALGTFGLFKMLYDSTSDSLQLIRLTKEGDAVFRFGLGLLQTGGCYLQEDKAFYICGIIDGSYGFYRSLNQGTSWQRINTDKQMFGDINSIDGDCRTFGRFYIATGSLGALYGDMDI
ncbi:MAG: endoglucanase [Lachnospiraceae bacterium]|nr:endoglucanase [Lachnospiraceae bacterium]